MNREKVIVVVDDEFIILESLKIQLSRFLSEDVILEYASSGTEALDIINEYQTNNHSIQLLVSDYNLDDMKGTDIVKYLHDKFPASKKVILTGQSDLVSIQNQTKEIEIDNFIPKPWNYEELKSIILKLLEN